MRMLVCGKCKYVMVNSHDDYKGIIVLVKSRTAECEKIPTDVRGCAKEWPRAERVGPVPGPDRPYPPLSNDKCLTVTGGFCNGLNLWWNLPLVKIYSNLPYKEIGDMDARDLFSAEPSIAGIAPYEVVKMDHKNQGKLSEA